MRLLESHAVGVATEVIEDMGGRAKRFFGIDHPRFFPQSIEERAKAFGVGPGCDLSDEEQVVLMEALLERVEKFSTEDQTQSFNRKEKILTGRNPTVSIKRQNTRGNQTVQMKMIQQGLIPGVHNRSDPQGSAQTPLGKLRQSL